MGKECFSIRSFLMYSFIFSLFCVSSVAGQDININDGNSGNQIELNLDQIGNSTSFSKAIRARRFKINPQLENIQNIQRGKRIILDLFPDRSFSSVIIEKYTDVNNVTTFVLKLEDFDFSFGYLSISKNSNNLQVSIPEKNEFFATMYSERRENHLIQLDPKEIEESSGCDTVKKRNKKEKDSPSVPLKEPFQDHESNYYEVSSPLHNYCSNPDGENASVTIDIMVVYSDEAQAWAAFRGGVENAIATALARANTVFTNSDLGINFNLVYSGPANYSDASRNSLEHLEALTFSDDGVMDELHDVRKNVGADMVAFLTLNGNVGGMAYVLDDKYGDPSSSFSLTRIQSALYNDTFAHELGHNLGAMHSKFQNFQAGPYEWYNWPENIWTNGWRWMGDDDNMYCTVMTYPSGSYFEDGINATSIPYFSNPDKIYQGKPMGDIKDGDNFRTLNYTKFLVANYSKNLNYCEPTSDNQDLAGISRVELGQITKVSDTRSYSDFSILTSCVYKEQESSFKVSTTGSGESKELFIWVDWNNNMSFESAELVYHSKENIQEYSDSFLIPSSVEPGIKRVRVRLHDASNETNGSPCGNTESGEAEDYSINVLNPDNCVVSDSPVNVSIENQQSTSLVCDWDDIEGIAEYKLRYRPVGTTTWSIEEEIFASSYKLEELNPSTEYEIQIASICASNSSEYSLPILVTTNPALDQLVFRELVQNAEPGRTLAPVAIEVMDVNGNLSNSSAQVSVRLVDENLNEGILNGNVVQNAIEGIAVFDNLSIDREGIYFLEARMDNLPVTKSNNFNIILYESQTFVVNTKDDTSDQNLLDSVCADINGNCSLRAAIQNANKTIAKDNIYFNIPGNGPYRIDLNKSLPSIKMPVHLNATTQPGFEFGAPQIVISGANLTNPSVLPVGFNLIEQSSNSVIEGFVIVNFGKKDENNDFYGVGIRNRYTGGHIIRSNFIGVDANGEIALPNYFGIAFSGENNLIGGPYPEDRNIISGNIRYGIEIGYGGNNNLIQGNYIGTNYSGTIALPNGTGVLARETNTYDSNLISGNDTAMDIWGDNNILINNLVGTDYYGKTALPNNLGIEISGKNNSIGIPGSGNIISGNNREGLRVDSEFNTIQGNIIGAQFDGELPLGNGLSGIQVFGNQNRIGGSLPSEGNVIAFNGTGGVDVIGIMNTINRNKIFGNSIGIDLGVNGISRNDRDDSDLGPNNYQNYPEISKASSNGSLLEISYLLDSQPTYSAYPIIVEVFKSDGNIQGMEYLGSFTLDEYQEVKGKNTLKAQLQLTSSSNLVNGDLIVTTATDAEGNTSEFSDEVSVTITGTCTSQTWYVDEDTDGLGDPNSTLDQCTEPEGYVSNSNDCDDTDPAIGAPQTWYWDDDGDGFGDANISIVECTPQPGYVLDNSDCNDKDASIYPGALDDTADGKDQNCDGFDGPVTSCSGADNLLVSEVCSTNTSIEWQIENPGNCPVTGRWELRKMSSTGDSSGIFELAPGEIYNFTSGTVSKGKTQLVVYWNDRNGLELSTSLNASGIECTGAQASMMTNSASDLIISPNPIDENGIGIYFTEPVNEGLLEIRIYNSSGNLIYQETRDVAVDTVSLNLEVDHSLWLEGVYIMNAHLNGILYQTQFIK